MEDNIISLKKFWEKINYLLPSTKSGNSIQLIDKVKNEPVSAEQTPNFMNNFFTNIGPDLDNNFDMPWHDNMKHYSLLDPMPGLIVNDDIVLDIVKTSTFISHQLSKLLILILMVFKDAFMVLIPHIVFYN